MSSITYENRSAPRLSSMSPKPRKPYKANWMSQPFNYGVKMSAKIGRRVSIRNIACISSTKIKASGRAQPDDNRTPIRQRGGVPTSERIAQSGTVAVGTRQHDGFAAENSSITASRMEDNPREQRLSNLRPQGDGQGLTAGENGYDVALSYKHSEGGRNVHERILSYVERTLRNILLLIGIYMFGVYQPLTFINVDILILISPMIGVAWCTCFLIQSISWLMAYPTEGLIEDRANEEDYYEDSEKEVSFRAPDDTVIVGGETSQTDYHPTPTGTSPLSPRNVPPLAHHCAHEPQSTSQLALNTIASNSEFARSFSEPRLTPSVTAKSEQRALPEKIESSLETVGRNILQPQNHPELEDLCIIDELTLGRTYPNGELINIDNVLLKGSMLPMIRTSDVDIANDATSNHFKGKQRHFEIQLQFKMKYVPETRLFIGFEMDEAIKLGMIQRALVGGTMNFMKKRHQGFIYNLSGEEERADGRYVKPHLSLPLETCADLFTVSRPGEAPQQLGAILHEDPEVKKIRKKGKLCIKYNTEDTYTVSIWSAYIDFIQWKVLNLPAVRPFSLSSVIGNQTFRIAWYLADPSLSQHRQCDLDKFVSFEFGHRKKSRIGKSAKLWMQTLGSGLDRNINRSNDSPAVMSSSQIEDDDSSTDTEQCEEVSLEDESSHLVSEDTGTLEELGEGLYLNSGDPIQIRESILHDNPDHSYVTNAGGFAVLQSHTASTILVEKVSSEERISSGPCSQSKLIKNGDTVMISLIEDSQNKTTKSTRYLSIQHGVWLKWVSYVPKTSGYFQIFTNEMEELIEMGGILQKQRSFEAQTSYVRLGGTFQLRVHNKSRHYVGLNIESSPTYGGRVMKLYKEHRTRRRFETDDSSPRSKRRDSIKPLYLCASQPCTNETNNNSSEKGTLDDNDISDETRMHAASATPVDIFYADAPAWLEIMHRRDRSLQLLYLVRISKNNKSDIESAKVGVSINDTADISDIDKTEHSRVRLRTGNNLAAALRLGLELNSNVDNSNLDEGKDGDTCSYGDMIQDSVHYEEEDTINTLDAGLDFSESPIANYFDTGRITSCPNDTLNPIHDRSYSSLSAASAADIDSDDSSPFSDEIEQVYNNCLSEGDYKYRGDDQNSPTPSTKKFKLVQMSKASIGVAAKGVKIAGKGVKIGTVLAGKGVMKSGKIVGQTMRPIRSLRSIGKPQNKSFRRKKNEKDHYLDKTLTKHGHDHALLQPKNQVMAGQLTAKDQTCRIVSHILSELSSIAMDDSESQSSLNAASLLSSQLTPVSEFDLWFLRGGSVELGVVPTVDENSGNLCGECVVARCLWESHWREEACLIYDPYVAFYAPLSKKTCLKLLYIDIQQVRLVHASDDINPLPGFPLISIDTASRCHYLAFVDDAGRAKFQHKLNSAIFACPQVESNLQMNVRATHVLKSFQPSLEQPLSEANRKWANITSKKKSKQRIIHNTRRMAFDSDIFPIDGSQTAERKVGIFVEDLLRQVLSFSLETIEESSGDFVHFLNCSSCLRALPLQKLNLSGKEAFCICVNLYHCLLQHSLLLSSCGPPTKRSIEDFMRTNCYEIGGDVFSLAELNVRVIRGNMSKAIHPRSPFVQAPRKSRAHLAYALGEADPRINFVLNTADMSKPSHVPILTPDELDKQLSACSTFFLRKQVSVDLPSKTVTLPKVCEIYRNDFGDGDANCSVHYCLQYLDDITQHQLLEWLKLGSPYIRYHHSCDRFHSRLRPLV